MKISVCIPAYKNAAFLKRCLDALVSQTFKDFEVVLSDDSPDESVAEIAVAYKDRLQINYLKNNPAKGTPANWNYAMQQAKGQYIKLMHDDDWFASNNALQQYYNCLQANPQIDFCFAAYNNVQLSTGLITPLYCSKAHLYLLKKSPYNLFKRNFIGAPSVVFQRNNENIFYDERFKWLVDFEGYIRFLNANKNFIYINHCLVNIGQGKEQVTTTTQHAKEVVVPESMLFLQKHGVQILKNIFVYDYFWRMFRNLSVKNKEGIVACGWKEEVPQGIEAMLAWQRRFPAWMLNTGLVSKKLMWWKWVRN